MINHKVCVSDEEVAWRITEERKVIEGMKLKGYPVKSIAGWQSPTTFETHAIPIMSSDTWQDVCNRYFDHFPLEARAAVKEIAQEKASMDKGGFSADKTLLVMGRVPAGLRKFLDVWHEQGDFWSDRLLRKAFFTYFSRFKMAQPYSASIVVDKKRIKKDDGTYETKEREKVVSREPVKTSD